MVSAGTQMNVANQQMADLAKGTADEASHSSQMTHQGVNAVNLSNQAIEQLVSDIELALTRSTDLEHSSAAITSRAQSVSGMKAILSAVFWGASDPAAHSGW